MVNPGAFKGSRKEFLMGEKATYSAAMAGGYGADALVLIQRRYFKRYPVDLPHTEEPSPEHLAAVDDDAPDTELEEPDPEKMTEDECAAAIDKLLERREVIQFRKAQIKRWLAYQYMKDNDLDPKDSGANNPYRALLFKLTGKESARPRRRTAVNVWRKTKRTVIEEKVKARAVAIGASKDKLAALRDKVAREIFEKLSEAERIHWAQQAQIESEEAISAWKRELESGPSTAPADRQRCIQGLVRYAQPILDGIAEATGWKVTLMAGGPEPAHEGRLNVISVHSGLTTGDVKMNFGRAERERYKKHIVPIFGSFLQKCYTTEECRSRALPSEEGFFPMESADVEEDGANIDLIESSPSPSFTGTTAHEGSLRPEDEPSQVEVPVPHVSSPGESTSQPSPPAAIREPSPPSRGPSPPVSPAHSHRESPIVIPAPPSRAPSPPLSPLHSRQASPIVVPASPSQQVVPSNAVALHVPSAPGDAGRTSTPSNNVQVNESESASAVKRSKKGLKAAGKGVLGSAGTQGRKRGPEASGVTTKADADHTTRKRARTDRPGTSGARFTTSTQPDTSTPAPPSSPASEAPTTITTPPDAPKWFENALSMLRNEELGTPWAALLQSWVAFEARENYEECGKLKSTNRPASIKDWIQRHRSTTWRPSGIKVSTYEKTFMQWWTSLQPNWRVSEGTIAFANVEGDWSALRRPGMNGLFSVFAALFYWGLAVQKEKKGGEKWLVAVEDCRTACTHLLRAT